MVLASALPICLNPDPAAPRTDDVGLSPFGLSSPDSVKPFLFSQNVIAKHPNQVCNDGLDKQEVCVFKLCR